MIRFRTICFHVSENPKYCGVCQYLRPPDYCSLDRRKLVLLKEEGSSYFGCPMRSDQCTENSGDQP